MLLPSPPRARLSLRPSTRLWRTPRSASLRPPAPPVTRWSSSTYCRHAWLPPPLTRRDKGPGTRGLFVWHRHLTYGGGGRRPWGGGQPCSRLDGSAVAARGAGGCSRRRFGAGTLCGGRQLGTPPPLPPAVPPAAQVLQAVVKCPAGVGLSDDSVCKAYQVGARAREYVCVCVCVCVCVEGVPSWEKGVRQKSCFRHSRPRRPYDCAMRPSRRGVGVASLGPAAACVTPRLLRCRPPRRRSLKTALISARRPSCWATWMLTRAAARGGRCGAARGGGKGGPRAGQQPEWNGGGCCVE
jgi:hypothetical protein